MEAASALQFAAAARVLADATRSRGHCPPSFRSPPRMQGVDRTLRRRLGSTLVAVRLRGRPLVAVVADMIDGVVVANRLPAAEADELRAALWECAAPLLSPDPDVHRRRVA